MVILLFSHNVGVSIGSPLGASEGEVDWVRLEIAIIALVASDCCLRVCSVETESTLALSILSRGFAADANERDRRAFGGSVRFCALEETPSPAESRSVCVGLPAAFEVKFEGD